MIRSKPTCLSRSLRLHAEAAYRALTSGGTQAPPASSFERVGLSGCALLLGLALTLIVTLTARDARWRTFFGDASGEMVLLCGAGAAVGIGLFLRGYLPFFRRARRESECEVIYSITPSGIGVRKQEVETRRPWRHFDLWTETEDVVLLCLRGSKSYIAIIRAAFDPSQLDSIREILTTNIAAKRTPPAERGVTFTQEEADEAIASERERLKRVPALEDRSFWFLPVGWLVLLAALSMLAWASGATIWIILAALAWFVTVWVFLKLLRTARGAKGSWHRQLLEQAPHRVESDEIGLMFEIQEIEMVYEWSAIQAYVELQGVYVLIHKGGQAWGQVISKRAFASDADRQAFAERLKSRLR